MAKGENRCYEIEWIIRAKLKNRESVIYPLRKYYLKRYGDTVRGVRAASKALHETELQTKITTNPWTGQNNGWARRDSNTRSSPCEGDVIAN